MTQPTLETESPSEASSLLTELQTRLAHALGPALGALVLDFADLITIGPLGIYGGLLIGGVVGWWMSGMYRFGRVGRAAIALMAGVYCMLPFTHFFPLATLVSAVGRFIEDPPVSTKREPV